MGGGRRPRVLFVCVHNAGRSQMAAALLSRLAGDRVEVLSAGTEPADRLHPAVVEVMREVGVELAAARPRLLTDALAREADVVITMGCGDTCPYHPGTRYDDWPVEDPAGRDLEAVRRIRGDIEARVRELVAELAPAAEPHV